MRSNESKKLGCGVARGRYPAAALLFAAGLSLPGAPVRAQQAPAGNPRPAGVVILTSPADARVTLKGQSEVGGDSPLGLPSTWSGRYSVTIDAAGYSTAQGVLWIVPERGEKPYALSEPPWFTGGLLIRSLNAPGIPAISSHHTARGVAFLAAGTGAAVATARAQLLYRDNLDEQDTGSQDRALDFRYARDRWAAYAGAVWGLSALDYMIRSRIDLIESTPTRIMLGTPRISRGKVLWRSLLVPGAGQEFANRRGRAFFWLSAALASGAAYVIADESHHRIEAKLARARSLLASAAPSDSAARQADVGHFVTLEETSRDLTDGLRKATIAVYGANLLDALLLPMDHADAGAGKVSLSTPVSPSGVALALRCRF